MPDYAFREPRLYLHDEIAAGARIEASTAQANYLGNVMRLPDGASVLVFDGRNGEWRARIERPSRKRLELLIETQLRPQTPPSDFQYLFVPLKSGRLDYMIQKATEMGAGTIQPVMTQHGQVARLNLERCEANAIEAAEQCGILSVPAIAEMRRLEAVLESWDPHRALVFCDEREQAGSPIDALAPLAGRGIALLIGPEGGFSAGEREMLRALPFVLPISLGPRILRADTAAVAALALVQAAAGDWRSG